MGGKKIQRLTEVPRKLVGNDSQPEGSRVSSPELEGGTSGHRALKNISSRPGQPHVSFNLQGYHITAVKNDIVLVLENEQSCNVGTGAELGRILKEIGSPGLRGNWDPGNAAMLDEVPYPDGYTAVKGLFSHMHVKDVRRNTATGKKEWAPVGGGYIDWKGQIQALRKDGYEGTMSLETHYLRPDRDKVESTRESLAGLMSLLS